MKKDVIYIDIEDDITAIVGKVKDAKAKIVALVPPKRIGVLQSAVNLKLLQKSATSADKRIVLITNDHSLTALAAGLKLPVAKNLQSRPEVPELEAPEVAEEEVINGEELPVGEIALAAGQEMPEAATTAGVAASAADDISSQIDLQSSKPSDAPGAKGPAAKDKKKIPKVPNFNIFRKKFLLIAGGGVVLIAFLIWALAIAPHATVTITAKTTGIAIDQTLTLDPTLAQSKTSDLKFKATSKQIKKSVSADFTATGTKDVGTKASGSVTVTNSFDSDSTAIPAGTVFVAASGQKFVSKSVITVPGAGVSGGHIIAGTAQGQLEAIDIGPDYNIAAQAYSISGYDSLTGSGSAMAGGDKQTVTVIVQADVDKAQSQLAQQDVKAVTSELKQQFSNDLVVMNESFLSSQGNPTVSPAVGEQAKQGKLTIETTYSMLAVARTDVDSLLNAALLSAIDAKANQSIYSNGDNSLQFSNFQKFDNGTFSARLDATGYIGPKINADDLTKQVEGKRFGEIQALVNQIPNVNSVDVKLSPFWVTRAPKDPKKIDIKFSITNGGN